MSSNISIDPSIVTDAAIRVKTADALDNEFRYYSKLVQELILMLSNVEDRQMIPPWVHKLSGPGYNVKFLRDKRNRFMLMLCMTLVLDSIEGPFTSLPPTGILPDILKIDRPTFQEFDFEKDTTWEEQLKDIAEINKQIEDPKSIKSKCPIHAKTCPKEYFREKAIGEALDKQFRYLLYLTKPYAAMLVRSSDRMRAAKWIQTLCSIDQNYCTISKGIRNDYMMILSGHLANQQLVGPFEDFPLPKVVPIAELAKIRTDKKPITDPTHPRTTEFFMDIPSPEEGAFAFIAVTGDLYQPKF